MLQRKLYPAPEPPLGLAVNCAVAPWQTADGPLIATDGNPFTVKPAEACGDAQPLLSVTVTV